jgi:hypothetical protein
MWVLASSPKAERTSTRKLMVISTLVNDETFAPTLTLLVLTFIQIDNFAKRIFTLTSPMLVV